VSNLHKSLQNEESSAGRVFIVRDIRYSRVAGLDVCDSGLGLDLGLGLTVMDWSVSESVKQQFHISSKSMEFPGITCCSSGFETEVLNTATGEHWIGL